MEDTKNILVEKKIIKTKEGKLPKAFDHANLTTLFLNQFVTWDEFHRRVIPRSDYVFMLNTYKDHIMNSSCNNNGKLDVLKRMYSRKKITLTRCKYIDEFRICLSVADMTPVIDGV